MDKKEEGMILGKLIAFEKTTIDRLNVIESKVDSLDRFKLKVTFTMVLVLGAIEFGFKVYEAFAK